MDQEHDKQYQQMRGEYLSLMASPEYSVTLLIHDELGFTNYHEAFSEWFIEAPIPFTSKISLLERMYKGKPLLKKYGGLGDRIRELHDFRNTLAHSFIQFDQTLIPKGKAIPQQRVSFETFVSKLKMLQRIEMYIHGLWFSMGGPMDGGKSQSLVLYCQSPYYLEVKCEVDRKSSAY
jgi:hypothetical protein